MLTPPADPLSPTVTARMRALGRARAAAIRASGVPWPTSPLNHPAYRAEVERANSDVGAASRAARGRAPVAEIGSLIRLSNGD